MPIKKIAIIGPESTGKSTLSEALAEHYHTTWAKEYAREFLHTNGPDYQYEDLLSILDGQINNEEQAWKELMKDERLPKEALPLFCDTEMQVLRIWSEYVFGKCDNRILRAVAERQYDLFLLCDIDLPWEPDELREYPDIARRRELFSHYQEAMLGQHKPWKIIRGENQERLDLAIGYVDELLQSNA